MAMKLRVIPRSESFYGLFEQAAANLADTAGLLLKLLTDFHDPEAAHAEIRQREHDGDEITHQIMRALNTTFVTPFDREDIHRWRRSSTTSWTASRPSPISWSSTRSNSRCRRCGSRPKSSPGQPTRPTRP